ncbi:MAG: hypothetical protein ACLGIP_07810 [Alphaproteobacteria bacterium]
MIFWSPKGRCQHGAGLFMSTEQGFRFIFSRLISPLKKRALMVLPSGLSKADDLALFLCPRLRVILRAIACLVAGIDPLQTDGAAK